ncbi:acyltransferase [Luteimicrobium sp. NPDC057192]|uniref:acyltransferase family protein n=1 Tax=Luteimicrobium sp. NPDC057192 TaxID=3346042 RepID=UPI003637EAD2
MAIAAPPSLPRPATLPGTSAPPARRPAAPPAEPSNELVTRPSAPPNPAPGRPVRTGATPAAARRPARKPRDLFVDVVRALGTLGVIALHWSMVDATISGGALHVGNALGSGPGWLVTWLMPLPLLFFAAGAAAGHERRATTRGPWALTVHRVRRLVRPVGVLLGAWAGAAAVLLALGVPEGVVVPVLHKVPQPLWFLGVYLALTAATTLVTKAVRRLGERLPAAVGLAMVAVVGVDVLRIGAGHPAAGWLNLLLVWLIPFALGVAYAEGTLTRRPAALVAGAVGGVVAAVALIVAGPYPISLVGMPGDAFSNLAPPTAPVAAFGIAQVCLALLARDALTRWATSGRGARLVTWVSARSMTLYLWHLTAMFAVAGVVMLAMHERLPVPWSADWWSTRLTWFAAMAAALAGLVALFGRVERRR